MDSRARSRRKSQGPNLSLLALIAACLHERLPITASNLERMGLGSGFRYSQSAIHKDLSALISEELLRSAAPTDAQGGVEAFCITSKGIAALAQWRASFPESLHEVFGLYHLAFVVALAVSNGDVGYALSATAVCVQMMAAMLKIRYAEIRLGRARGQRRWPACYQPWLGIMSADLPAAAEELELELSCRRAASLLRQRAVLRQGGELPGMALTFEEAWSIQVALEQEGAASAPAPPAQATPRERRRSRRTSPTAPVPGPPAPAMPEYGPPVPPSEDPPSGRKPN